MSEALDKAHQKRAAMKSLGVLQNKTIKFSGTDKVAVGDKSYFEVELLKLAASRAGAGGMTEYVRELVFAQAKIDSQKPVAERHTKTPEQIEAEIKKLEERLVKVKAATPAV